MGLYDKLQGVAGKVLNKYGTAELKIVSVSGGKSFMTSGVFTDLNYADQMNDSIADGSQQVIISGAVAFLPAVGDYVERSGMRFVISRVSPLGPAKTNVIITLLVNR